jgi:hypothetical protein
LFSIYPIREFPFVVSSLPILSFSTRSFDPQPLLARYLIPILASPSPFTHRPSHLLTRCKMPKGQHRAVRSQGYYRLTPVTTPTTAYAPVSSRPDIQNGYYNSSVPLTPSMSQQSYTQQPSGYPNGGPVQLPLSTPQYTQMAQAPPLASIRPSSGAWNPQDDQTLMAARAQGMNWAPIQQAYFPSKTPNACRKRHERLMERRSADDWDGLKLESLAKNYMGMRREIWSGLAAETGEKWNVVEQKVLLPS